MVDGHVSVEQKPRPVLVLPLDLVERRVRGWKSPVWGRVSRVLRGSLSEVAVGSSFAKQVDEEVVVDNVAVPSYPRTLVARVMG